MTPCAFKKRKGSSPAPKRYIGNGIIEEINEVRKDTGTVFSIQLHLSLRADGSVNSFNGQKGTAATKRIDFCKARNASKP